MTLRLLGDTTDKRHWECSVCGKQTHILLDDTEHLNPTKCSHCEEQKTLSLIGKKYGRLTVLKKLQHGYYSCQCECGNITQVYGYSLTTGKTRSCGCLKAQQDREARIDKKRTKLTNLQNQVDRLESSAREKKTMEQDHLERWHQRKSAAIEEAYEKRMRWVGQLGEQIKELEAEIERE